MNLSLLSSYKVGVKYNEYFTFINAFDFSDEVPVDGAEVADVVKARPVPDANTVMPSGRRFGTPRDQVLHEGVERLDVVRLELRRPIRRFKHTAHLND